MKTLYVRNMFTDILKRKKTVGISVICFVVVVGFLGYRSYANMSGEAAEEQIKALEDYKESLEEYDKAIAELEASIVTAQEQVDLLEEYCSNSIYMQLNSQKIQISTVQYGIQTNMNLSYILSAFTSYINDGSLKDKLAEELKDIPTEYLKEIIVCSTNGNLLTISVMHYDMNEAQTIMELIEKQIQSQSVQIAEMQGEFTLVKLDSSAYVGADAGVMNNQNVILTNYKNNGSALSGLQTTLADRKNNRRLFVENNEPEDSTESGKSISIIFKYLIFGIFLGVGFPAIFYGLRYIMSDRLRSKENLLAAGIAVLGSYNNDEGYVPQIDRSLMDIQLLAGEKQTEKIFLNILGEGELQKKISREYTEQLGQQHINVLKGYAVQENAGELKQMLEAGNCILVAEAGNTTYTQLEEQIQLCHKFGVDIWGCIVIE